MKSVCEAFSATAMNEKALVWVIFDSYEVTTTKYHEQKRRKVEELFPDVVVEDKTLVPQNKAAFLSNQKNKQNLIMLLEKHLRQAGVFVAHAG